MPGMGLRKEGRWVAEFPNFKTQLTKEGLGFFEGCDRIKKNLGTLNRSFVKEGGDLSFYGFPELWVDKDRKLNLGWEIFLMIVDTQFCTHDLIKENDLNDHPCTSKIMIALHASICSCIVCINLSLHYMS